MKKAIYPGSFDPVTLGHLDVIEPVVPDCPTSLIIGVLHNNSKTPLFSVEERVNMLKEVTKDIRQRGGEGLCSGLMVDFVGQMQGQRRSPGASCRSRILSTSFRWHRLNRVIAPEVDTIFLTTNLKYSVFELQHLSRRSRLYGGDIIPILCLPVVAECIRRKMAYRNIR